MPTTVRVVEIAELLGVTHQRASQIVDQADFTPAVEREARAGCGIAASPGEGDTS